MSASPEIDSSCEAIGCVTQAIYFGPGQAQLFGWLHHADASKSTELGIVLCNPFGYEAICSHRSVRAFSEAAASVGVSALRFDYRGTGDSSDLEPDVDQIEAWTRDVAVAVSELRLRTGVKRVCLLGFRLGALLAALVARDAGDVDGLIVIAPVVGGRRYVKEMRITRMAALLGSDIARMSDEAAERTVDAPTSLEVSGYLLSPASIASLMKIDLTVLEAAPAPRVLAVDGENLPSARKWTEALRKVGASTTYETLPGIVEMLMTAPQFAAVPQAIIGVVQKWLLDFEAVPSKAVDQMTFRYVADQKNNVKTVMTLPSHFGAQPRLLTERAIRFGIDAALFGIVTEPPHDERRRRAVILLNPGVDHHIGASRLYVAFARQWSSWGYIVLRMDLAGIGDSATRAGDRDDEVFPASALQDIRSGIDYLIQNYSVGDVSLVGLCSGAYHALRAAAAGIRVQRILMINPQNYFWKEGMTLQDLQLAEVVRNPGVYSQRVLSAAAWRRLLGGDVDLSRIAKVYFRRVILAIVSALRDLARRMDIHLPNDLARELEEIAARGVGIVFIFAPGEPGIDLLKLEAGSSVSRLGGRCQLHVLKHGDHVFSHHDSRAALAEVLGNELLKKVALKSA